MKRNQLEKLERFIRKNSQFPSLNYEGTEINFSNKGNGYYHISLWFGGGNWMECIASIDVHLSELPNFWGKKLLNSSFERKRIYL